MALSGISKYRPQLYTPRYLSEMNRQAVQSYSDATQIAADKFVSALSDQGSTMVTLIIQQATQRIQNEARAKIAKQTASLDITA